MASESADQITADQLFRQQEAGAWAPVFEQVRQDLAEALAAKRAGEWPK